MMMQSEENSPFPTYVKGNLYQISIVDFRPDPEQPRKVIDPAALEELKESIRTYGILQPLLFRAGEQGWVIIVSGERRYQAAKELGLLILPAICVDDNYAEIALVENLQRQDLTCIEEAEAMKKLMDNAQYTQEQLAKVIAKPRGTVTETLSLMNLPVEIRNECRADRTIPKSVLVDISRKKQQRSMLTAWAKYKEELRKKQEDVSMARVKRPASDSFCQAADKMQERVRKTDVSGWSEEELAAARDSLNMLRDTIASFPYPAGSANLA
jgi:ParB family chromosome partitioning protein